MADKPKKEGVGALAVKLIKEGKDNESVLDAIKKAFKGTKASLSSIAWYRNKLRADGVKGVKTNRELTAKKEKPAKKSKKAASKSKDPLA